MATKTIQGSATPSPFDAMFERMMPALGLVPEIQPEKKADVVPVPAARSSFARSSVVIAPARKTQPAFTPERALYREAALRLEPEIAKQAAATAAVATDKGLKPGDLKLLFEVDITGSQKSVCVNCGNPACRNFGKLYRTQNTQIDLLSDSIVVFLEVASRIGVTGRNKIWLKGLAMSSLPCR